jgi:hypothetical protein
VFGVCLAARGWSAEHGEAGLLPAYVPAAGQAERYSDLTQGRQHGNTLSNALAIQGSAFGRQVDRRPGMNKEPQQPVSRRPDRAWIGLTPRLGPNGERRGCLAVAALHVA